MRALTRPLIAVALAVAGLAAAVAPAGAAPPARGDQLIGAPVRFEAAPGTVLEVPGVGRFVGAVEVHRGRGDDLIVVNHVSMDAYISGLAEMPASWPMEALKAQAVAARSYAWYSLRLGTFRDRGLPYDICSTVACQVFSGRSFVESKYGHRWLEAVRQTSGEVLTWEDAPIMARFYSSGGGASRNNEEVFGWGRASDGHKPYLIGAPDPHESISPLHEWELEVSRAEFDRVLSRHGQLRQAVPIHGIRRVLADGESHVDLIEVTGQNGRTVRVMASRFRSWLSQVGPRVLPHRFPIRTAEGRAAPDGVPSSRIDFSLATPGVVRMVGHGWGHGVGMSQWGARGKAEAGWDHAEILAAYYNGVRPTRDPDMPTSVRVGVEDGADDVIVRADGPYRVVQAGKSVDLLGGGLGWLVRPNGPRSFRALGPVVDWASHDPARPIPVPSPATRDEPATQPDVPESPAVSDERVHAAEAAPPATDDSATDAAADPGPDDDDGSLLERVIRATLRVAPITLSGGVLGR